MSMFTGSKVLITGGTGSWGKTLTSHLLNHSPKEIIIFSRGELHQVLMKREFKNHPKIKFIIGDIRDFDAISRACVGVNYIFHLAALKHVPVCESQPQEAIKTNINGTVNLINAAIQNGVTKVIDVSTDKACEPLNLYGMTKAVGEKLVIQANNLSTKTSFVCIRGGNVMGSNGSVIPFFIEMIKNKETVKITDLRMTRYFLSLDDAIGLLFKASESSVGGETFVMNMPSCYIRDLVDVLMEVYGKVDKQEIGIRPGEKLDEVLISNHEASSSYEYDNDYFVILPTLEIDRDLSKYKKYNKVSFEEFSSKTKLMGVDEIKKMLKNGNFI